MDKGVQIILGITAAVLVGLVVAGYYMTNPTRPAQAEFFGLTDVRCITDPSEIRQSVYPTLSITVDGEEEMVHAGIGIREDCIAELPTLSDDGLIRAESADLNRTLTLGDFFMVWAENVERPGMILTTLVNGEEHESPRNVILENDMTIELQYVTDPDAPEASATTTEDAISIEIPTDEGADGSDVFSITPETTEE